MWTLSGSCPLCLTPPCYHLEPPATAAPFFVPIWSKCGVDIRRTPVSRGNYIGMLTISLAGHDAPARVMLTQSYTGLGLRVSEALRYVRETVERNAAGLVRGAARQFA